jgi:thiamine-phosphate pyrophosphorylase
MQLYYITDRNGFPGDETARRRQLLNKIREAARAGVDYIQVREKDLTAGELEALGREAVYAVRQASRETRLLLNSRTDVALAIDADGVHVRGDDVSPREVVAIQSLVDQNERVESFLTIVSCHSVDDVHRAESEGANFAVLAPIYGKDTHLPVQTVGLESLTIACQGILPIFALGGVTLENARDCIDAGAAGIAAIRLFQNNRIDELVLQLHRL